MADGDSVVVLGHEPMRAPATGRLIEVNRTQVWTFKQSQASSLSRIYRQCGLRLNLIHFAALNRRFLSAISISTSFMTSRIRGA
jgi:hypothetical protein